VAWYATFSALRLMKPTWSRPFALTLGVTRRGLCRGTALPAVVLAAIYRVVLLTILLARAATTGWGTPMHFVRVPCLLYGRSYLTWL